MAHQDNQIFIPPPPDTWISLLRYYKWRVLIVGLFVVLGILAVSGILLVKPLIDAPTIDETGLLPPYWTRVPPPGKNNVWYERNSSDTVFVFVHGIFSDSRNCWLALNTKDQKQSTFWPELVSNDQRFNHPSVFLGGYSTSVDSGPYDVRQAAVELREALKREGVLEKKRIIFIGHSTGGIVVRFLIQRNQDLLRSKIIGLALDASPSIGSEWARTLGSIGDFYGNALAQQLRPDNTLLRELDKDFQDLLYNPNSTPQNLRIVGAEGVENFFVVHRWYLPDKRIVVPEESASRYFGAPQYLAGTDHFTSVKPTSEEHPAHKLLISFYSKMEADYPRSDEQSVQELAREQDEAIRKRVQDLHFVFSTSPDCIRIRTGIDSAASPTSSLERPSRAYSGRVPEALLKEIRQRIQENGRQILRNLDALIVEGQSKGCLAF